MLNAGPGNLQLFIRLTPEAFESVRKKYGATRHVGREMPREIPKSWTYISEAWNKFPRAAVTSAVETATGGDARSVTFYLYGDGTKQTATLGHSNATVKKKRGKKNNKAHVHLTLPKSLDKQKYTIAKLTTHFGLHQENPTELYASVAYQPTSVEIVHVLNALKNLVDALPSKGLPAHEIYRHHVTKDSAFEAYSGLEWEKWFVKELGRLCTDKKSTNDATAVIGHTVGNVLSDANMIRFVQDLATLAGPSRDPSALLKQWLSTLEACSSQWCPPPLWWCLGSVLVGSNLAGMTRSSGSDGTLAATCLENWDMLTLLKLLQSKIYSKKVNQAAWEVQRYTRTDIAHERFDCDFRRDWNCMAKLLDGLGCSGEADSLRKCCEPKFHSDDGGEGMAFHLLCFQVCMLTCSTCVPSINGRSGSRHAETSCSSGGLGANHSPSGRCRSERGASQQKFRAKGS